MAWIVIDSSKQPIIAFLHHLNKVWQICRAVSTSLALFDKFDKDTPKSVQSATTLAYFNTFLNSVAAYSVYRKIS